MGAPSAALACLAWVGNAGSRDHPAKPRRALPRRGVGAASQPRTGVRPTTRSATAPRSPAPAPWQLFDAQLTSRHLDLAARWLRSFDEGFYTIGSSGHEGNAAVAAALRPDDPALLHYRSGGVLPGPRRRRPGDGDSRRADPWWTAPGTCCAAWSPRPASRSPAAGTRSSAAPTCTSSRPPRRSPRTCRGRSAWRTPSRVTRARRRRCAAGPASPVVAWPDDAIVVASFGDASVNHATATAAFNAAGWYDHSGVRAAAAARLRGQRAGHQRPVAGRLGGRPRCGPGRACATPPRTAATWPPPTTPRSRRSPGCGEHRRPAVLHLSMVRLMGHAGADAEVAYRTADEIAADLDRDPLVGTARLLVEAGLRHARRADHPVRRGRLAGPQGRPRRCSASRSWPPAAEVVAPLAPAPAGARRPARSPTPPTRAAGAGAAARSAGVRRQAARAGRAAHPGPDHQRHAHRRAAGRARRRWSSARTWPRKGGVYGVTKGLRDRFGADRVFDTLLDETSILGLALGAGLAGLLPIPEIQYLAYLHNAEDQLRGEAATMPFFSPGRYRNPMVRPGGRAGLPGELRRALPQRQLGGRAARRTRAGAGRAGPPGRRRADAADLPGRRRGGRQRLRLPRADRALPHP